MKVREQIRGIEFELKDSFVRGSFEYEGHLHVVPNGAGLECVKMVCNWNEQGDFHYVLVKWD